MKKLVVALTAFAGLTWGVHVAQAAASATPDPFKDEAQRIACPAAPLGWFNPPGDETGDGSGGREILTPLTSLPEAGLYGGDAVEVDCDYFTTGGRHLRVSVRYALPIDPNPFSDFYFGCTTNDLKAGLPNGAFPWDTKYRLYRVVSLTRWSVATFYDYLHQLSASDVSAFEDATRMLLKSSEPEAHDCTLAGSGGPVATQTIWDFGFDARVSNKGVTVSGGTEGSFVTTASTTGGTGSISKLSASTIFLVVRAKGSGQTRSVTVRVGRPIDFHAYYGATLRAAVDIVASTYLPCHLGAMGTLTVSTARLVVLLDVCGRNLLQGDGRVDMHIEGV